ncbi:MAG: hypothetical protein FJX54_10300 [Alphaproteobacteria bacterium]|nr:hypothetical protein [Alphaproteobacteria bacterium]
MTRKLLMITTAVAALAIAPAVHAQSTSGTNSTASGVNARPPAANSMATQAAPNAAATPTKPDAKMAAEKKDQSMSPKGAMKSASKMERKDVSKASLKAARNTPEYRAMNDKEIATTRDLNRQARGGGVPQSAMTQSSMVPSPMAPSASTPGMAAPFLGGASNTAGASGPGPASEAIGSK